jgi:serine O-acetyltransferase
MSNSDIKRSIKADLYRIYPMPFSYRILLRGLGNKGFKYMFFNRLRNYSNPIIKLTARIMIRILMYRYDFQIPRTTIIGPGFYIGHFGTVVVSSKCRIGRNCNIAHCCTLAEARGKQSGAPKIGNFVWIGTGAVVVGNITIEDHVMIAPNAFVNFDVPTNSLVIGNPGKIISKENPTKYYINNAYLD